LIAAITAGSIIVVGGVTLAIMSLMNKDKGVQEDTTSNVNDDVSDIEVYDQDIPQVDIDTDAEV
jgi:hypothetical protein